jgi:hypothetical protein
MNEYTDLQVIECNRLHSEEAKSNNNENFALWTNNLQDIVHLEPGDKVSVYGAIVSERGAGQNPSIEIKGDSLGIKKTYGTLDLQYKVVNASEAKKRVDNSDQLDAVYTPVTKEIFDNKGYFVANYFVPANGHNYIDLPHRWWYSEVNLSNASAVHRVNWITTDNQSKGMSLADPFGMLDSGAPPDGVDRWELYDDYYQITNASQDIKLSKLKKDNARYTIMIREHTYNSSEAMAPNVSDKYKVPPRYLREPEFHTYRIYRELKEIEVPVGFNSPDYLATEITRQLQKVKTTDIWNYRSPLDEEIDNPYTPGFPIAISKQISTETYKPFNVASYIDVVPDLSNPQKTLFDKFINASTHLTDGYEYLSQYTLIACKRPELYEYGRLINRNNDLSLGLTTGSHITTATAGDVIKTNLPYDNTNILNDFKNFIQAQEKYPEVFNIFSDSRTPYNASDNINNCRWVHINRFKNASMTLNESGSELEKFNTATLGHGGYSFPTWNASKRCMKSIILPIEYDPSQRDTYYKKPNESDGERTYGCFGRSINGEILIYGTKHNGPGSTLMNQLYDPDIDGIEASRKIGFDQHFSAPGMTYILPCDMRPNTEDILNEVDSTDSFTMTNGYNVNQTDYETEEDQLRNTGRLYFGANSPRINWNGANFTISDLHTAMNRGNQFLAKNPYGSVERTADESDVVYKINPREDYNDFTPARKPYVRDVSITFTTPAKTINTTRMNSNLEAWRVYDCLTGIMIEDFGLNESEWENSLWRLMGFSYKQFHSSTNTRLSVIDYDNINDLSIITTNSEINEGDTKLYIQNLWGVPMYYNKIPYGGTFSNNSGDDVVRYLPEVIQKTQSMEIIADNLPTKMIRGYYTIRSNILEGTPFIGGKVNNTTMPIVGVVDKINGDGDFYFQQESSLQYTITKPLRLASLTCSIHDPDGSYARVSEQSTILFKIEKDRRVSFDVVQEILAEEQQKGKK